MASWQSHDGQNSESRSGKPRRYDPTSHGSWIHETRLLFRNKYPLWSQVINGEIKVPEVIDDAEEKLLRRTASRSLASTRSNSYTITGHGLSDLVGEASSTDSEHESASSADEGVPGPRRSAKDHGPRAQVGSPTSAVPADADGDHTREGTAGGAAGGAGARSAQVPRRSARLRRSAVPGGGSATEGSDSGPTVEAAADAAASSEHEAEVTEEEEKQPEAPGSGAGGESPPGASGGAPPPPPNPTDERDEEGHHGDGRHGDTESAARDRLVERLQRRLEKERRRRRRGRAKSGYTKLVQRAKAVKLLVRQTIEPHLWDSLPEALRTEVYNVANNKQAG